MAAFVGGCIVYGVNRYLFGGNADLSIFFGLLTSMWIHANELNRKNGRSNSAIVSDSKQEG